MKIVYSVSDKGIASCNNTINRVLGCRSCFPNIPLYQLWTTPKPSQGTQITSQHPRLDVDKCNCIPTCTWT